MTTAAAEAAELAEWAGRSDLSLDPWQLRVLEGMLGRRRSGRWSAPEVGVVVPRQNGKGGVLEARELLGLFVIGESIVHSAHLMDTSKKAHKRFWKMVERTPDLAAEVVAHHDNNNELSVELRNGAKIEWVTRSQGSARGWTEDLVILDEAFALTASQLGAILPVVAARPNWQVIYTSSAGQAGSSALRQVRRRGTVGEPRLAYYEWSIDADVYRDDPEGVAADPGAWAEANPALGIRIEPETLEVLQRSMPADEWAREFLGIWDDEQTTAVIPLVTWERHAAEEPPAYLEDPGHPSQMQGAVVPAMDVAPDAMAASLAVCGRRPDGVSQVEVVTNRPGTAWVIDAQLALAERHLAERDVRLPPWRIDPSGPAGELIPDMEAAGVEWEPVTIREFAQACGAFRTAAVADEHRLRHLGQPELAAALPVARRRPVGDGLWAWGRRGITDDISPLVAVTLAHYGLAVHVEKSKGTTNLW